MKTIKILRSKSKCALDLGDGSERAEYVNQDYILRKLGRPHRGIMLMYTYYPKDKQWPQRISHACKDIKINSQWEYAYDDYFPYKGGIKGCQEGEPFNFMRDIRRHGQDITLTLTIDCSLEDEYLRQISEELKRFGHLRIRINHECAGTWFTHNKRFSYKEIGNFFVRFHKIIKEIAPNIQTIFCAGFAQDSDGRMEYEDEFLEAYRVADIWSVDFYLALHYGWPFDIAEKDSGRYCYSNVDTLYHKIERTAQRLQKINGGVSKPLVISEFNTDGDVTGPYKQGESIKLFTTKIQQNQPNWLSGLTYYQFRDRGRLGLEIEDPNNNTVGITQPVIKDYLQIIHDPFFMPTTTRLDSITLPVILRWGNSEDAEGLGLVINFDKNPIFCEISFNEALNLIIELNGTWFYKAPWTRTVDLIPAFYQKPLSGPKVLELNIFAPPENGENIPSQGADWTLNYYATISKLPELRIRYESIQDIN